MERKIVDFHQDEQGDWIAVLERGHQQHVRHHPPLANRPWVLTAEGRRGFVGQAIPCTMCDTAQKAN